MKRVRIGLMEGKRGWTVTLSFLIRETNNAELRRLVDQIKDSLVKNFSGVEIKTTPAIDRRLK